MEEEKEAMPQPDDSRWRIALAIVCAGILGYGLFYSKNTASDFAYLIGFYLVPTLIVWGIFYVVVARQSEENAGRLSFIAIFICMIASALIRHSQLK